MDLLLELQPSLARLLHFSHNKNLRGICAFGGFFVVKSDLYDEYISMSVKQKEIFRMSIYDNDLNTRDIVTMIRALKQVFCGW